MWSASRSPNFTAPRLHRGDSDYQCAVDLLNGRRSGVPRGVHASIIAFPPRIVHEGEELRCGELNPLRRKIPQSRARLARFEDQTRRARGAWHLDCARFANAPRCPRERVNLTLLERYKPRLKPRLLPRFLAHESAAMNRATRCKNERTGRRSRRITHARSATRQD